jgi:RNA polymerase sigma-70 factor (ECF subfamily)
MSTATVPTLDPDSTLLEGLRAGDEDAFAELVQRHGAALLRHARTFVQSASVADEVVQEAWLAVVTGVARFEGRSLLRTWLYGIVANRARTRAVRERRCVPFSSLARAELDAEFAAVDADRFFAAGERWAGQWAIAPSSWAALPDEQAESAETLALVAAAIAALPAAQREVVRLRDVEGWDAGEVCATLALSAGNQRVLLHRGRCRVRAALEAHLDDRVVA